MSDGNLGLGSPERGPGVLLPKFDFSFGTLSVKKGESMTTNIQAQKQSIFSGTLHRHKQHKRKIINQVEPREVLTML